MRRLLIGGIGLFAACLLVLHFAPLVSAMSLKISPLRYDTSLAEGEKKKGFVDVTNPTAETAHITLTVQAFRQVDNNGSLEFYDSETVRAGVLLDLTEVDLGPRETLHLAFVLDGTKLTNGDNFAAIFASVAPKSGGAGEQTVRVGTILVISNGTATPRRAAIENLSGKIAQFGDGLRFTFDVHNTAATNQATGFAPTIRVSAWPYINDEITGPLVFAGRTRAVEYVKKGSYLGLLAVHVKTGDSEQIIYRLAATGYWRYVLPAVGAVILAGAWFILHKRQRFDRGRN